MGNVADVDVIETYRRIMKSAKRGQGTRLTPLECWMIARDEAIIMAVEAADIEDEETEG